VGNVTCTVTGAPCIAFGAPGLELRLNGFFITGQADPTQACSGTSVANEVGISTNGQNDVEVKGPYGRAEKTADTMIQSVAPPGF
jgi:hypothetical protein